MNVKNNHKLQFFSCIFTLLLVMPVGAQESFPGLDNLIPPSPNASAIITGANIPVSCYTGIPSVQIPLWEMKGRKLSVPITLSYHGGGVKVSDIAGWVGLGWSLNAGGVISRTIRGRADDLSGGYLTSHGYTLPKLANDPNVLGAWEIPGDFVTRNYYLQMVADGKWDAEPDIYFFSFNGRSGKFFFDVDGKVVLFSKEDMVISPLLSSDGKIDAWEIVDERGTIFRFGFSGATETTALLSEMAPPGERPASSWYLQSMTSANAEDRFDFEYSDYTQTVRYPLPQKKISGKTPNWDELYKYSSQYIKGKMLKKIKGPGEEVDFNAIPYGGYIGGNIMALALMDIHNSAGQHAKSFSFEYSFFPETDCGTIQDYLPPCRRLRLDKVTEIGSSGSETKPPYIFMYDDTPLPPRGSFSQDYWGYYNGAENEFFIPAITIRNYNSYDEMPPGKKQNVLFPFDVLSRINLNLMGLKATRWEIPGANRDPDPVKMQAGVLKKIIYPNGGSTLFDYEPNDFGYLAYHPRPEQLVVDSYASSSIGLPVQNSKNLHIQEAQEISFIPLFYIMKGSQKDNLGLEPGDNSAVYITGYQVIDQEPDTLIKYSFSDLKSEGAWDVEEKTWLPAGDYKIVSSAEEQGDIVKMILRYDPNLQQDTTYRIFSREFEKIYTQAGEKNFPDDSSYIMTKDFEIDSLDDFLVQIEFKFRSKVHPNRISILGLPFSLSSVRLSSFEDTSKILFEKAYYGNLNISWDKMSEEWFYEGKEPLFLNPGHYRIDFLPRISSEFGYIKVTMNHVSEIRNRQMMGGLRIRQITDIDNASDTLGVTNYTYQVKEGDSLRSSGVLSGFPLYYDLPEENYYLQNNEVLDNDAVRVNLYSRGKSVLGSTSGSPVGYSHVEVLKKGSGKTVYCFTSAIEYPDESAPLYPYPPAISFDWKRGLIKEKDLYSEEGRLQKVEKSVYNELKDTVNHSLIPAIKIARKAPGNVVQYISRKYMIECGWNTRLVKTRINYDLEGNHPVENAENFKYSSKHLQLVCSETLNSDSSRLVTTYLYPDNPEVRNIPISQSLLNKHMTNTVLRVETSLDSVRISGQKTKYAIFNDAMVLPASVELLDGDSYQTKLIYDRYDSKGNILQYHRPGDITHAMNWDKDQRFPVAKVENATYHANVKDYPPEAIISKFTYHPFWGISSITDPTQITKSFIYDDLGRLSQVKNNDHEILSTYSYHLKPYKGDTTRSGFQIVPITFSVAPTGIIAPSDTIAFTCPVLLEVAGGKLGTGAKWVWYADQCAGKKLGEGNSISVAPISPTYYFVRAEGDANNTACASIHIYVDDPDINPVPASLNFQEEGSGQFPFRVDLNYTGCDVFQVSKNVDWLTIEKVPAGYIYVRCDTNQTEKRRTGSITIQVNYTETSILVRQEGTSPLTLSINYTPALVSPATQVDFEAIVGNGSAPFDYLWEFQIFGETAWQKMRDVQGLDSSIDHLNIPAPDGDFYIRCTVGSAGKTVTKTLEIRVLQ